MRQLNQLRMIVANPLFDRQTKFEGTGHQFVCFSIRGQASVIVIHLVALAPASVEVIDKCLVSGAEDERRGLERRRMMATLGGSCAVARAGQNHFRKLLDGVIGHRETPVGR